MAWTTFPKKDAYELQRFVDRKEYLRAYMKMKECYQLLHEIRPDKFDKVISSGSKKINKAIEVLKKNNLYDADAKIIFKLYETYGIPFDLIYSVFDDEGIKYDKEAVMNLYEYNRVLSRQNAEAKFGDNLAGNNKKKVLKK